ncbi:MAG: glycoside hydrolase family 95 protein [Opitutaceae bacterium]|nr:glycoside hydrolase family 95 protein [Opitutaceae bacterium]
MSSICRLSATSTFCALLLLVDCLPSGLCAEVTPPADTATTLWYEKPAGAWVEALPVGNGRMGAMVFGGVARERIQFNEQTLWTGTSQTQRPLHPDRPDDRSHDRAMGDFQPFGDVFLVFEHRQERVSRYQRRLDLDTGIAATRYIIDGVEFTREVFATHPGKVVVVRISASAPGALSFRARLSDTARPPLAPATVTTTSDRLAFAGRLTPPPGTVDESTDRRWNGMRYHATLRLLCEGGRTEAAGGEVRVVGADACTLLLAAATDYVADPGKRDQGEDPGAAVEARLAAAASVPYAALRASHLADYSALFARVRLRLDRTPNSVLPTDRRLQAYTDGAADPELESLLFHYGRYLLISSSRPGGLPANLQGLWNEDVKPAWYSGYTTNINVEMNYWLAESTHLAECHLPLLDWIDLIAAAQKRNPDPRLRTELGWTIYSTNNPFGGNSGWAFHRPGSAWLSQHFYEAWAFGGDRDFLARRVYPHLRELARMWDAHLVEDGSGHLITPDGWSPEHGPIRGPDGRIVIKEGDRTPQPGASYDQQIIWDLFTNFIEASAELEADPELRARIAERRARLLGPRVGSWGQIQEWRDDVDDPKQDYRHIGHLFALHPGRQIDPVSTPELARAAKVTLDSRGDRSCGWSRAAKLCLWARLHDGNRAGRLLRSLLEAVPATVRGSGSYSNLFGAGPPFQIDANFGYAAGVAEMLLQSHLRSPDGRREIHLLPAIPDSWREGEVNGLRARGGFTLDQRWKDGRLHSATIVSMLGKPARLVYRDFSYDIDLPPGGRRTLTFP